MLKLSIQKKLVLSYAIVIILTAMVSAIGHSSTIQNVQVADNAQEVLEVLGILKDDRKDPSKMIA